jgi:co-chaperonin GroES (HSP10)
MENNSGITPTGDMILVEPFELEEKTEFGIVIAQGQIAKEKMAMCEGRLVAIGGKASLEPRLEGIVPGDFIMFAKWCGQPKKGKDERDYRLMRAADVMAKIEAPSLDLPKIRMPLNPAAEFAID